MAEILQGGKRDKIDTDASGAIVKYAVSNITQSRTLNCDGEAGALALADVVGTLIRDLVRAGVINGVVA